MKKNLITETAAPVTILYTCDICNTTYTFKREAIKCSKAKEQAKKIIASLVSGTAFITKKFGVIVVEKIDIQVGKSCLETKFGFNFIDSNDCPSITLDEVKEFKIISIHDAVMQYHWRVAFKDIWAKNASKELQKEYLTAIKSFIGTMREEEKEHHLLQAIAFNG